MRGSSKPRARASRSAHSSTRVLVYRSRRDTCSCEGAEDGPGRTRPEASAAPRHVAGADPASVELQPAPACAPPLALPLPPPRPQHASRGQLPPPHAAPIVSAFVQGGLAEQLVGVEA